MESSEKFRCAKLLRALALCGGFTLTSGHLLGQPNDHSLHQATLPIGMSMAPATKFQIEFSPSARWSAPLRWKYNHAKAPPELIGAKAAIIAQLQASFDKWTTQCAVVYQYDGETTTPPNNLVPDAADGDQPDRFSVVGWASLEPAFGAWTYAWYAMAGTQRVLVDADVELNAANVLTLGALDRLMSHEWGHALGLAHSNLDTALMAGPPMTSYSPLVTPQADDVRGCRCLYGLPPGTQASYVCSLPLAVEFGNVSIGMTSAPRNVTFTNSGNAPLSVQTVDVVDRTRFQRVSGCDAGSVVGPGESCTVALTTSPVSIGFTKSQLVLFTSEGYYELPLVANGVEWGPVAAAVSTVDLIEYYNETLDHYFITSTADEIASLDAGTTSPRWFRTGKSFKAFATAQTGTSPVCRFYIPPALGNSHFFGRGEAECNATLAAHPDFVLEDPSYMQLFVPSGGSCPPDSKPIYRVFNNLPGTNHRYTTERTVRDEMVGRGWVAEGDGADVVAMCGP